VTDLKAQWEKTEKEELHTFCQNTERDKGESYFEGYYRSGSSQWFREVKMNCPDFVSVRQGHSTL
jgi:hypothetical protein